METQINLLKILLDRKAKFKLDINNDSSLKEFEGLCREIESLKKSLKDLNFMEYGL